MRKFNLTTNGGEFVIDLEGAEDLSPFDCVVTIKKVIDDGAVFKADETFIFFDRDNIRLFAIMEITEGQEDGAEIVEASSQYKGENKDKPLERYRLSAVVLGQPTIIEGLFDHRPTLNKCYFIPVTATHQKKTVGALDIMDAETLEIVCKGVLSCMGLPAPCDFILPPAQPVDWDAAREMLLDFIKADLDGKPYKAKDITAKAFFRDGRKE